MDIVISDTASLSLERFDLLFILSRTLDRAAELGPCRAIRSLPEQLDSGSVSLASLTDRAFKVFAEATLRAYSDTLADKPGSSVLAAWQGLLSILWADGRMQARPRD